MPNKTQVCYYATAAAAGATGVETAITLTKSSAFSATTSAVSFVVPAQNYFIISSITFSCRGHNTATAQATTFKLRVNTLGAVTTSSTPILIQARVCTPATANITETITIPIVEGYEIFGDGTLQIGVTASSVYTTNAPTWDVLITGYEFR